jgi:DNA ligase 1
MFNCRRLLLLFCLTFVSATSANENAPPILLANVLLPTVDVSRYLVSEKYDGVRAIWDGKQTLRFRSGREIAAPTWFIEKLPNVELDGELWMGRRTFDTLSGIVRAQVPDDAAWKNVRYMIFEMPNAAGTFEQRVEAMRSLVKTTAFSQLEVVPQFRVTDRKALKKRLDATVKAGGEGLMLHRADALYVTGRSDALFKLKPLLDTEGTVIAHLPGQGKHKGKMGALRVRMDNGVEFRLGTGFTDAQRANPPPIGAQVTFAYRELSKTGKPRFAKFVRVREKF